MADDDEGVGGNPSGGDLFGPPGPRRSNFTPAPTDAQSLEAAANVFNDDAIAAALAAELARVASGPIPIQVPRPASTAPAPTPAPAAEPEPVVTPEPQPVASAPVPSEPVVSAPVPSERVVSAPVPSEPVVNAPTVEPVADPQPIAYNPWAPTPAAPADHVAAPVDEAPESAPAESTPAPTTWTPTPNPEYSRWAPAPEAVASGPVEPGPVKSEPVESEPEAVASAPQAPEPEPASPEPASPEPTEPEQSSPAPEPTIPGWTPAPEPVAPEPTSPEPTTPEPTAPEPWAPVPSEPAQPPIPQPEAPQQVPPLPEPTSEHPGFDQAEPAAPVTPSPAGPPDWASSLFGQPTPTIRDEDAAPVQDPFAPSAPSFAPSTGAFPPPSEVDGSNGLPPITSDPEALRALYRGAPAPTVPPADAPPPPGYGPTIPAAEPEPEPFGVASAPAPAAPPAAFMPSASVPPAATSVPSAPDGSRRQSLNDEAMRAAADQPMIVGDPDAVQALQSELHLSEKDAREFSAWESSMQAIGTPEALAEIARARSELEGAALDAPSAPSFPDRSLVDAGTDTGTELPAPTEEPAAFLTPPPVEEPAAFLPPPAEEPAAYQPPPPVEEPAAYQPPPPVEEPAAYLPPPAEEPVGYLPPPPVEEPAAYLPPPPVEEPAAYQPPAPAEEPVAFLPPPVDEPAAFMPPPEDSPAPSINLSFADQQDVLAPPSFDAAPPADAAPAAPAPDSFDDPYAPVGVAAPSVETEGNAPTAVDDENPFDAFIRMAEEREEHESVAPAAPNSEESPFPGLEPPTESPFATFETPSDPRELQFSPQGPIPDAPVFLEPHPLVEPASRADGVAELYRDAGETPPPLSVPSPPTAAPVDFAPPTPEPAESEPVASAPVAPAPPAGFDDLLTGSGEPQAPVVASAPWFGPGSAAAPDQPPVGVPVSEPQPTPVVAPNPIDQWTTIDRPAPGDLPAVSEPPASSQLPAPFESLATPEQAVPPQQPVAEEPAPAEPPAGPEDPAPGDHRPFGVGVDRDEAVDPSDSIFGAVGYVSVNTAGVAVVSETPPVEISPVRLIETGAVTVVDEPQPLVAPPVVPAEEVGLEPTPEEQRVGRSARLFWMWFAANSSIVGIVFGTIVFALGVSVRQAIVAALAGVALSFIPLGLGTLAGKRSGQPTMVISRATFGIVGNILPALVALFSRLLWAGALLWVLGEGVAQILVGAKLSAGFTPSELTLIGMAIGFVIAIVIAYFGYGLIARVQLVISIVSSVAIIGFVGLTAQYMNLGVALTVDDGPWILVVTGTVLVFSFVGLAWANTGADVARYQRVGSSGAASMLWATFGAAVPTFVLIAYGALLAASNPTLARNIAKDPLDSLGRLLPVWYPAPLLIATALSLISAVVLSMYSGGFALQAAGLRLRRPLSSLLVGVLVIVVGVLIYFTVTDGTQLLRDVATTMAVPIAAWVGIFVVETMIRKQPLHAPSLLERGGRYADVRWFNLIALVVISIVGFGFLSSTMPALGWEGYGFATLGVSLSSQLAQSELGVLVALALGMLVALATGFTAVRQQEGQQPVDE